MIDFKNPFFVKLRPLDDEEKEEAEILVRKMLVDGEEIFATFKGVRDMVIFTNKRAMAVNVQGIGKKVDYTSLPYSRVQAFSVETVGAFDRDCEVQLWFSGLGCVKFEFSGSSRGWFDIKAFNRYIANYIL